MEIMKKLYQKEEDFLSDYEAVALVAARTLKDEWQPNYDANENVRKNQDYFYATGELEQLVFDSASIYHDNNVFSSAQIILKSSQRLVNVRVRIVNGKLVGEKIITKTTDAQPK